MINLSFIPSPEIRQIRDLMRYRSKLTNMVTGEKNRAQNCLTVSNLKLDDVFSDVFGKSARSLTNYILDHPGETFDVAPFVDKRCKTPQEIFQIAEPFSSVLELLYTLPGLDKNPMIAIAILSEAIIAVCKMLLTAIWNMLSKLEPYNPDS